MRELAHASSTAPVLDPRNFTDNRHDQQVTQRQSMSRQHGVAWPDAPADPVTCWSDPAAFARDQAIAVNDALRCENRVHTWWFRLGSRAPALPRCHAAMLPCCHAAMLPCKEGKEGNGGDQDVFRPMPANQANTQQGHADALQIASLRPASWTVVMAITGVESLVAPRHGCPGFCGETLC